MKILLSIIILFLFGCSYNTYVYNYPAKTDTVYIWNKWGHGLSSEPWLIRDGLYLNREPMNLKYSYPDTTLYIGIKK